MTDSPSPLGWAVAGLLALVLLGLIGFMIYESWTSPVEDALEARLRQSAGLVGHVQEVQCGTAAAGAVPCEVAYVSGTQLATVSLALPVSALPFPAAFTVGRERSAGDLVRVRTPYDGKAMAFEAGALALQASVDAVTRAADHKLGAQLQQGLNALTYERAAEAAERSGDRAARGQQETAAVAVPDAAQAAETMTTAPAGAAGEGQP